MQKMFQLVFPHLSLTRLPPLPQSLDGTPPDSPISPSSYKDILRVLSPLEGEDGATGLLPVRPLPKVDDDFIADQPTLLQQMRERRASTASRGSNELRGEQ